MVAHTGACVHKHTYPCTPFPGSWPAPTGDPGPILTLMKPTLEEATVSLTSLKGKQEG